MSKQFFVALLCFASSAASAIAQDDTLIQKTLGEVVVSVNKWEQKLNEVPNRITKITQQQVIIQNPQTTADLLAQSGTVFIQKSQLGGGSPMIRGFATNRVLLSVDGVRMNNAIYRSGNIQNVISIDPLSIESAEVIFGPGSLIYGSDAIGGVMDFRTMNPRFAKTDRMLVRGSALMRYSTANKERTGHADLNLGWKKLSMLASLTYSKFDDLKMGKHGGDSTYLRPEYIERIDGRDSIVRNPDPRVQRFSGYQQTNFLYKISYRPLQHLALHYGFTYAGTGDAPRYDRLIQYRQGRLRFAEWSYGPMLWRLHNLQLHHQKINQLYKEARLTAGYQNYEESRIDRARGNNDRNKQQENVKAISVNFDATKDVGKGELFYGIEYVHNKVNSTGSTKNILTNVTAPMVSRYPDGSTWSTSGIYASYKINVVPKLTVTAGLRYSYNTLKAKFDTTFIKFPYRTAEIKDGAVIGNAGLVYRADDTWQINGMISSGYRMPNVDDIGKLFESTPGNVSVPNPDLRPEYAWNFEVGVIKNVVGKYRVELSSFYSILNDAIVRRPFTFGGQDSITFQGVRSRVEALQNVANASVYGLQAGLSVNFLKSFLFTTNANWIAGKETDDVKNEQVPLRHAPPFYGSTSLKFTNFKLRLETSLFYNSEISAEDLAPTEQAKTEIYARDKNGKPFSPGWYTLNVKGSYQLNKHLLFTAGWENINNQRYRPYSSGIVAAGSNIIVSVRASF
jgi:hemoglobin/transferrin/lactoferrin receptor protein